MTRRYLGYVQDASSSMHDGFDDEAFLDIKQSVYRRERKNYADTFHVAFLLIDESCILLLM